MVAVTLGKPVGTMYVVLSVVLNMATSSRCSAVKDTEWVTPPVSAPVMGSITGLPEASNSGTL